MKKHILLIVASVPLFLTSQILIAAQGDVSGSFLATLKGIRTELALKKCEFRADVSVIIDHRYSDYDRVYGITMDNGSVARVEGGPAWIYDVRSVSTNDPLRIIYYKSVPRFFDCPETIRLKYNSLTKEIREI